MWHQVHHRHVETKLRSSENNIKVQRKPPPRHPKNTPQFTDIWTVVHPNTDHSTHQVELRCKYKRRTLPHSLRQSERWTMA